MRRTIPELRDRLHELADELGCPELRDIAEETRRRYHGRAGRAKARHVTPELADKVRAFKKLNPGMIQRDIGDRFKIDHGRVSEILYGKRGEA